MSTKTYGSILREAITLKGFTFEKVAKAAGTHKGYISGICNRKNNPPSAKLTRRLCKLLDLDVDQMLARSDFEKIEEGLPYALFQVLIDEARADGVFEAPGSPS